MNETSATFPHHSRAAALLVAALSTALAGRRSREAAVLRSAFGSDLPIGLHLLLDSGAHTDASTAALWNGALIHCGDYDDTHQGSVVHPSAAVLPAALVAGSGAGRRVGDLVLAYACGIETAIRLGASAPGRFHAAGFHATGVVGPVGAAVAAALLLDLPVPLVRGAAAVAATHSGGTFEYIRTGGNGKIVYPGLVARWGLEAARLAAAGLTAPAEAIGGEFGLLVAHTGVRPASWPREVLPADLLEGDPLFLDTAIKSYPCCYYSQVFLDATAEAAGGLPSLAVAEVVCEGPGEMLEVLFSPAAERRRPTDTYDAKFSLPFQVGTLLVAGGVTFESFTSARLGEPDILAAADRVVARPTDALGRFPAAMAGRVTIRTSDGVARSATLGSSIGAERWDLGSDFIAARLRRDLGAGGARLIDALADPDRPVADMLGVLADLAAAPTDLQR